MLGDDNNVIIWLILGAMLGYFLLTTWLGKRGSVHSKSMKGFAIAKGKVSPWLVGISFGASYASANLFIGVPGWAYTYGAPVLWYSLGCLDRKSTRLNSSHVAISYAVFCLNKKKCPIVRMNTNDCES